ncbi:MAG TPA: hypothetical protein VHE99_06095 [Gammaproteobacteria bacterium]|nr:hypothetical protein [Gammaproteobacteria bacterium]
MKIHNFNNSMIKNYQTSEDQLLGLYLDAITNEPKSEDISQSLYLTCLALQACEQLGNKFPTQEEIDVVEKAFKRFSRRKSLEMPVVMFAA